MKTNIRQTVRKLIKEEMLNEEHDHSRDYQTLGKKFDKWYKGTTEFRKYLQKYVSSQEYDKFSKGVNISYNSIDLE